MQLKFEQKEVSDQRGPKTDPLHLLIYLNLLTGSLGIQGHLDISCASWGDMRKKQTWNGPTMVKNKCPRSRSCGQVPEPGEVGEGVAEAQGLATTERATEKQAAARWAGRPALHRPRTKGRHSGHPGGGRERGRQCPGEGEADTLNTCWE